MFKSIQKAAEEVTLTPSEMCELLGHSILLGLVLVAITYWATSLWGNSYEIDQKTANAARLQNILGAFNLMFLCSGLTGVMLLVNNNLVRAFAIVACLALVRFRVKLGQKDLSASFLFAILIGMACGVNELIIAWLSLGAYAAILLLTVVTTKALKLF